MGWLTTRVAQGKGQVILTNTEGHTVGRINEEKVGRKAGYSATAVWPRVVWLGHFPSYREARKRLRAYWAEMRANQAAATLEPRRMSRQDAKRLMFGELYGMGVNRMGRIGGGPC